MPESQMLDRSIAASEVLAHVAASRRLFEAVIQRPCPVHDVATREPCWTIAASSPRSRQCRAVCDERIARWKRLIRASGGGVPPGHLGHLSARAVAPRRRR